MIRGNTDQVPLLLILLFLLAALLIRSWADSLLVQRGMAPGVATYLSYLLVPLCLATLLWPALHNKMDLLQRLFSTTGSRLRTCLYAVMIGVLLRLVYWAQLITGVSLGAYTDADSAGPLQPVFSFACPTVAVVLLGLFVMSVVTPLVEEFVHRGLIQSSLHHRGPLLSIGTSALLFTVFHRPSTWGFVLFAGLVLGALFWKTRTLWLPVIAHATTNGISEIDWKCLNGRWNPPAESLPLWSVAATSLLVLALCIGGLAFILCKKIPGSTMLPGSEQITERVRPAQ
ncbi:MAG: CPBP family intramembrane metalloprotease [Gammaproteobacteria bacterium]|nr:CPBP family intramembrane metalloprotease [Gammaproteobacteria bacterium]